MLRVVAAQSRRAHGLESRNGPPNERPRDPSGESPSRSRTGHRAAETPPCSRARNPSGESTPCSRARRPLGRDSASLEVASDPRRRTYSPDQSIKCTGTAWVLGSKANPRHAGPLTPPGNHIPAMFHQPTLCGHPRRCAGVVREGRCQLHDMVPPTPAPPPHRTPQKRTVGPSKGIWPPTPHPPRTALRC
jgi:hypothetical protein